MSTPGEQSLLLLNCGLHFYLCRVQILSLGRAYGWAGPSPQASLASGTPCRLAGCANLWELLVLLGMGGGEGFSLAFKGTELIGMFEIG